MTLVGQSGHLSCKERNRLMHAEHGNARAAVGHLEMAPHSLNCMFVYGASHRPANTLTPLERFTLAWNEANNG